ncbi:potassium/proton antiporter [soil metagenome]
MASGLAAATVADRVRVPGLLLFLGLGILIGSEGIGGVDFTNAELTRTLGTIGLVLILFEGGLAAGWSEIKPVIGTAVSLAGIGTIVTALITGGLAALLFNLSLLEGLISGAAVAASDSAAIFAVLRGSNMRRGLARSLEGESGLNDPIALLLVTGFVDWIQMPDYGIFDMVGAFAIKLSIGLAVGLLVGYLAREAFRRVELPSPGLYPVASLATAALAFGLAEVPHGSGFLSVYIAALILGDGAIPARGTTIAFHQGLAWTAQISLFALLGLLVIPSGFGSIAIDGILLSLALIFVARPVAALIATQFGPFALRERVMLGWAGLRGAVPIWLATFPVVAGVDDGELIFNVIFFVVVLSTLVQGATIETLAKRLGVVSDEPALPTPLIEMGKIRGLGGESFIHVVDRGDAAAGALVRDLGLPRDALVNLMVRDGAAIPPRGSTEILAGNEIHVIARREALEESQAQIKRWREGPLGQVAPPQLPIRGVAQVFTVRPAREEDGDPGHPRKLEGVAVATLLRERRDQAAALVALVDGRVAVTGDGLLTVGPRRAVAEWSARRASREEIAPQDRSWLQEVVGALGGQGPGRR